MSRSTAKSDVPRGHGGGPSRGGFASPSVPSGDPHPRGDPDRKVDVVRVAARHECPTAVIDKRLETIRE